MSRLERGYEAEKPASCKFRCTRRHQLLTVCYRVKQTIVGWFSAHYYDETNAHQNDVVTESLLFIKVLKLRSD